MKPILQTTTLLASVFLLIAACSKNDDKAPIDQLPPATQTGAGTAGCLVNGKALLPKGTSLGGPVLSAFYQYLDGEYFFSVSFKNNKEEHLRSVSVATCMVELEEGGSYTLVLKQYDGAYYTTHFGKYLIGGGGIDRFETSDEVTGMLTITHLDPMQSIISGTFWFDAINEAGEVVQVREGRFDMHYIN